MRGPAGTTSRRPAPGRRSDASRPTAISSGPWFFGALTSRLTCQASSNFGSNGRSSSDSMSVSEKAVSSQRSQSASASTTGMRSWIFLIDGAASVVTMVQDSSCAPFAGSFHRSHRPAKANGRASFMRTNQGCFPPGATCHSYQPSASTRQRRLRNASRNEGFSASVSDRALIMRLPIARSFAHFGTSPQCSIANARAPSSPARIAATSWVGAML